MPRAEYTFTANIPSLLRAVNRIMRRRRLKMYPTLRSHDHGIPDPRLQEIVELRLKGDTYAEIGKRLGVGLVRVRQIIVDSRLDEELKRRVLGSVRDLGKTAGRVSRQPNATTYSRTVEIVELRKQGLTLREVGARLNISHERVRQIIAAAPPEIRDSAPRTVKVRKPDPPYRILHPRSHGIKSFRWLVGRWLLLIDHAYCELGHHAVPIPDMMGNSMATPSPCCRRCKAAQQKARYHAPDGKVKEYGLAYQAAHREAAARAVKRCQDKLKQSNPAVFKESSWWQRVKADPVRHAEFLAKKREKYAAGRMKNFSSQSI